MRPNIPIDDTPTPQPTTASFAWEVARPRRGFLFFLLASVGAVNGALLAMAILTLSLKSTQIDEAGATNVLSLVVAVGSIVSMIAYPLIGRLSDRSLSRFGRRRPFLVGGAILLALGGIGVVVASDALTLTLAWVVVSIGAVSSLVAAASLVPDQIEPARRGLPSAMIGLGAPIGAVLGLFFAQLVQPNLTAMVLLPTGVAVVFTLALAFFITDRRQSPTERPGFSFRELLGTFWVDPKGNSAFYWAWGSRFLIFFGIAAVNSYQAFYLIVVMHQDPATVGTQIFIASLILTGISLVLAPLAGKLSDKIGRRKPFVIGAAVIFGIGLGLVAMADSFETFLLAIAVMGVGQGVYLAVDFALVTELLPDQSNPGKDLGLMNLAGSIPSTLVPAIAPALLAIGATAESPLNFTSLFVAGAIAGVLGGLFILPIKKVR